MKLSSRITSSLSFLCLLSVRSSAFFAGNSHTRISSRHDASRPTLALKVSTSDIPQASIQTQNSDDEEEPWWKNYQIPDEDLARTVRPDFPILSLNLPREEGEEEGATAAIPIIYLDSAATSQKPLQVTTAINDYYHGMNSNVHRGAHHLSRLATSAYEKSRDSVANLIGANRNEVIFTSGATEAINLVARSYGKKLREGDEVVLSVAEHHSNIVPWQLLREEKGIVLRFVPLDKSGRNLDWDAFRAVLGPRTKFVSLQHVSNVMGTVNPVREIVERTREAAHPDCKIMLDACQSVPHMKIDVGELGVDFLAASGHKMCGPTGIGFLWGKEAVLNSMDPFLGGGEMIDEVTLEGSTYAKAPARFEAGTPQIAQAIGLGRAIEYLESVGGMERIHKYETELGKYLMGRLEGVKGVDVLGPPRGVERAALAAFHCSDVHPSDLSTFLDMEGVAVRAGHHCCQPLHTALGYSHSARASLYFYNTKEDIDVFIEKLEETLDFFRSM